MVPCYPTVNSLLVAKTRNPHPWPRPLCVCSWDYRIYADVRIWQFKPMLSRFLGFFRDVSEKSRENGLIALLSRHVGGSHIFPEKTRPKTMFGEKKSNGIELESYLTNAAERSNPLLNQERRYDMPWTGRTNSDDPPTTAYAGTVRMVCPASVLMQTFCVIFPVFAPAVNVTGTR